MKKNKLFSLLQDYIYGLESPKGEKLAECIEETGCEDALHWLRHRTSAREAKGVVRGLAKNKLTKFLDISV